MTMANTLDSFRPIPFYFLTTRNPDDYTTEAVGAAMDAVKAAGFGGIVFFNKPPHGFDEATYLSDFYYEVLEQFVLASRERELALWINDGFNFPPGDAAGRIEKRNPTLTQQRIRPNEEGRLDVVVSHGIVVAQPWQFVLNVPSGTHHLVLRCSNTMANRMERYAAPSGLVGTPHILRG